MSQILYRRSSKLLSSATMLEVIILVLGSWLTTSAGFHLGVPCHTDVQCTTRNSFCDINTRLCMCKPSHPLKLYNSVCVEVSRLGERCELSVSCGFVDEHSLCHIRRGCICKPGYREQRIGSKDRGKCVYKNSRTYRPYQYLEESDEYEDSHEDDEKNGDHRKFSSDITTPVIAGLVLGTLIVCGWSFAICRLYLKKTERRCRPTRRKHLRHSVNRLSRSHDAACPSSLVQPQYALLDLSTDQPIESVLQREGEDSMPSAPTPPIRYSSLLPTESSTHSPSPPLILPDEEMLPAYYSALRKDPGHNEPPPSYDEVMKQHTSS